MNVRRRREFLADVGRGMLVASLGSTATLELGLARSFAADVDDDASRLTFGALEPLVALMQETPPEKLMPLLVQRLHSGVDLKMLVAAASLANARAFGGQDYTGFHTFMALVPALHIANELPAERRALPVLKVIYRNSARIQEQGMHDHDTLAPLHAHAALDSAHGGEQLRDAVRAVDWQRAESQFAARVAASPEEAFNDLQFAVEDEHDVHRVVFSWRAWAMLGLTGEEHAQTLLRQSVRYCLDVEQRMREKNYPSSGIRQVLPRLLDEHKLLGRTIGGRPAEDQWTEQLAQTIFAGSREEAATAVASALAEGFDPEAIGESLTRAANLLVLHDPGRSAASSAPNKPPGCVHGDSTGVHASDAANAWRNIARVGNPRTQIASLIVGAYHTGGQSQAVTKERFPYADQLEELAAVTDGAKLITETEQAVQANDQARACALVDRYGQLNLPAPPIFDLMRKYAVSEDGALHAEKYFRTVTEEYAATSPAYRWRQMIALARVTASEHGYAAPGYQQACELLGVS
jgi:hypothetical protein